jgi:hypothetical protein
MAIQKIGLEGVFKTEAFAAGLAKYTSGIAGATSKTIAGASALGSAFSGVLVAGAAAFAAIGVAAIAAGGMVYAAISKMVYDAAALGDQFSAMSGVTGISTTRLQELTYAGKLLDVEVGTITSGLRFLTRNMFSARDGTGETADAFKQLGVDVVGADGLLRDNDVVFGEVIDALGLMTNETERDALAMKVMGRSAMELNPLIKAGSAALAEYSAEAHIMGAVIGEEDIAALDLFQDRMDALKLSTRSMAATIALNFLPAFANVQSGIRGFVKELNTIFKTSDGDMGKVADGVTELLVKISKNISKSLPKIVKSVVGLIKKISASIIKNVPILIKAGGELLIGLLKGFSTALPGIINAGIEVSRMLYDTLIAALPDLLKAGGELLRAIGQGMLDTFSALPSVKDIIGFIFQSAADIATAFKTWVDSVKWSELSDKIAAAIENLEWSAYGTQFTTFITKLGEGIYDIVTTTKWGTLFTKIGTAIGDFIAGAVVPGETWATVWKTQWGGTLDLMQQMIKEYGWVEVGKEIGRMIVEGLCGGLISYFTTQWPAIKARFEQMFGTIKIPSWFSVPGVTPNVPPPPLGGGVPIPSAQNNWLQSIPKVPIPGYSPAKSTPIKTGTSTKAITNNITVNNPIAEMASTSVDKTLKKISYLGVT